MPTETATVTPTTGLDTHPLLAGRWSPTIFDASHELASDDVELLLRAAQWAPSASNTQPWAFVVCHRGDANHQQLTPLLSRGNAGWVPAASAVLIGLAQTATGPQPDAAAYSRHAEYDTGQAIAHLTLQARAMGLEAHQFAGFDRTAAHACFRIPSHFEVMVGIALGRPGGPDDVRAANQALREKEQRPRERREVRLFSTP